MNGIENVKQIFIAFTLLAVIEYHEEYGEGHHPADTFMISPDQQTQRDEGDGLYGSILSGVIQ